MVGNLEHGNAAHENRRQKAAHVVDDAAAERDQHAGAIGPKLHHFLGEFLQRQQSLLLLAAGQIEHFMRDSSEARFQDSPGVKPEVFRGDHENPARLRRKVPH